MSQQEVAWPVDLGRVVTVHFNPSVHCEADADSPAPNPTFPECGRFQGPGGRIGRWGPTNVSAC
ncbi:uncharacterized protein QC761_0006790 [Podospora bellae-mahoneyi]|uniref:Uncharacterized protein n=1 Tax=Podospora bellae-mahoneyi TaxID=2093777 RepID=A0ABR0FXY2_9PEZI|nr:hypothetical protein QC761_0006790 [Podospora bellae-mahoneyi]